MEPASFNISNQPGLIVGEVRAQWVASQQYGDANKEKIEGAEKINSRRQ